MDVNIITDHQFDMWCLELVELSEEHPEIAEEVVHHVAFHGFDGSTGSDLPFLMDEIVRAAERLVMQKRTGRI